MGITNKLMEIASHPDRDRMAPVLQLLSHMLKAIDQEQLVEVTGGGPVRATGYGTGFGLGVAVTAGLGLVPSMRTQVPGQPPGFQRRHEAVFGPKVTNFSNRLSPGPAKEFVAGMGAGGTDAPGWTFRHGL